jgi:hypothetical protein
MRTYRVRVTWQELREGLLWVEAESEADAIAKASETDDLPQSDYVCYIEDSFEVDRDSIQDVTTNYDAVV